jgi:hypothetical protein
VDGNEVAAPIVLIPTFGVAPFRPPAGPAIVGSRSSGEVGKSLRPEGRPLILASAENFCHGNFKLSEIDEWVLAGDTAEHDESAAAIGPKRGKQ